ncbi:ROK family protein [Polycladomyces subterraneus]|uniref:ROK family protein n=1 Tax=Polycladomyces subterraneus TaxID=1016997 RepID=A0ABT8IJW5_9BACL|nr:ROK family protein [Polycladomyces subterraneus]MDN4593051.1 ROK family protein [Polycladomyces subterraneus]
MSEPEAGCGIDMKGLYVGIDLGGTKIAGALVDKDGSILRRIRLETRVEQGPQAVIDRLVETIVKLTDGVRSSVKGVGVAVPGPLDSRSGVVFSPPNLPGWVNVPLRQALEDRLGIPVKLENDANAAAWGEYWFGAGQRQGTMIYLTVSTGVGSGLVLDGQLYRGENTFAGEIGHTIVDPEGPPCGCGRQGCLESLVSGTAIAKFGQTTDPSSLIHSLTAEDGEVVRAEHVFEAYRMGDAHAEIIVRQTARYLAIGLSNVIHIFNPGKIVVGGGVSRAVDVLFPLLQEQLDSYLMAPFRGTCEVESAALGEDAGVLGAAALWTD